MSSQYALLTLGYRFCIIIFVLASRVAHFDNADAVFSKMMDDTVILKRLTPQGCKTPARDYGGDGEIEDHDGGF